MGNFRRTVTIAMFGMKLPLAAMQFSLCSRPGDSGPNIVFIIADDLGYSDLGCYGGEAATPNLDRLASEGVRFTHFYNGGKCEPSRVGLITGHRNTKEIGFYGARAENFLPTLMQERGYRTLMLGKWHVDGHPMDHGFDRFFGIEEGACDYYTGSDRLQLDRSLFAVPDQDFYTTDAFTDKALEFLADSENEDDSRPFFLYLAYTAPHEPLQAPQGEIDKYRGTYLAGWEFFKTNRFLRVKQLGLLPSEAKMPVWPQNLPRWSDLSESQRQMEDYRMATYTAMIDRMDQNIGRVLQWLDDHGEREHTLVIFVSDNGANPFDRNSEEMTADGILPGGAASDWSLGTAWAHVCNTPYRLYKRNQHEGGICAPMILCWPGAGYDAGSICHFPVNIIDFLPTFYTLGGGAELPSGIEGTDLAAMWAGGDQDRSYSMMGYLADHRYVRDGDWKLVSADFEPWELYDLSSDRTETSDLATSDSQRRDAMAAEWEAWYSSFSSAEFAEGDPADHMGDRGSGALYVPSPMPIIVEEFDWGTGIAGRETMTFGDLISGVTVQSGSAAAWTDYTASDGFAGSTGEGNGFYALSGANNNRIGFDYAPTGTFRVKAEIVYQSDGGGNVPGVWLGLSSDASQLLHSDDVEKIYVRMNPNGNLVAGVTTLDGEATVENVDQNISFGSVSAGDRMLLSLELDMDICSATAVVSNMTQAVSGMLDFSWTDSDVEWSYCVINQTGVQSALLDWITLEYVE